MGDTSTRVSRRFFLGVGVGVGAAGTLLAGCSDEKKKTECSPDTDAGTGTGGTDTGEAREFIYPNQDDSEVRWGFLIDLTRCSGCQACSVACKTENDVRLGVFRNGVRERETGSYPDTTRQFVPWLCNHCKQPTCIGVCPVPEIKAELVFPSGEKAEFWAKATYQRPDGLVLIDQDRCVGCGKCVRACPYQARYLDPVKPAGGDPADVGLEIESPKAADKCTMCEHRIARGVVPACVNTCPSGARIAGNLNDPDSAISQALAAAGADVAGLLETVGTQPQVFYIGLDEDGYKEGTEARLVAGLQTQVPEV